MYVQVGDFCVSRGPPTVQLTQIFSNAVFFKSQNPRKAGTLVIVSSLPWLYQNCKSVFWSRSIAAPHWQILRWNVSKSWLQKVDFFENYAIVAMQSDNANFYACKIIKVTSGFDFKKTFFSARGRHHPKNSWNIFQIQITPLFWCPQGP